MSEWGNKKMFGVCGLGGGYAEAGPRQSPGQGPGGQTTFENLLISL